MILFLETGNVKRVTHAALKIFLATNEIILAEHQDLVFRISVFSKIQHFITVYNFYHPSPEIEKKWKLIANIANIID